MFLDNFPGKSITSAMRLELNKIYFINIVQNLIMQERAFADQNMNVCLNYK